MDSITWQELMEQISQMSEEERAKPVMANVMVDVDYDELMEIRDVITMKTDEWGNTVLFIPLF